MLSRTSFFNATLFRKNLTRSWPLWGMASFLGGIFPLAVLVQLLQDYRMLDGTNRFDMTEVYYNVVAYAVPITSLCYAILCAMHVWSYLYNARSVGFSHTLPIRREGLFFTNFLSGMTMMAIPYAVTGALCLLVSIMAGAVDMGGFLITVLAVMGESFFYFASATLVAFMTANIMALPVLYFIFHFLAPLLDALLSWFARGFFFGFYGDYTGAADFLSPTVYLMKKLNVDVIRDPLTKETVDGFVEYGSTVTGVELVNGWLIAVYALVGVVMTACAWLLYQRHRSESAGEVVAVRWMKPVFRYGVAFCGALTGGLLLYFLFWGAYQNSEYYDLLPLALCLAVAGAIGYYIASMLLAKSLRVFKGSGKGLAVVLVSVAAVCGVMHFDLVGVEGRVPASADIVERVVLRINSNSYLNLTLTDPEAIGEVLTAHRAVLEHKEQLMDRYRNGYRDSESYEPYEYAQLRVEYTLRGGVTFERRYDVRYLLSEVDEPGTAVNALKELHCSPTIQSANLFRDVDRSRVIGGYLHYPAEPTRDQEGYLSWEWKTADLTVEQAAALVEAARRDVEAGNFGRNAFDLEKWNAETCAANLTIYYSYDPEPGEDYSYQSDLNLRFSLNSTNLIGEMLRQGLITRDELYTEAQVYDYEKRGYVGTVDGGYSAPALEDVIAGAVTESESIGIIGGADGPTAIIVAKPD